MSLTFYACTRQALLTTDPYGTAKDFIRGLLEYDPKTRMSLTDACSHEWLADERASSLALHPPPPPPLVPILPPPTPQRSTLADASMASVVSHTNGMAIDDNDNDGTIFLDRGIPVQENCPVVVVVVAVAALQPVTPPT